MCLIVLKKKFRGAWAVGVMLKVPVWNWGEGKYKVRAAKAEAQIAALKTDEVREKIELRGYARGIPSE